MNALWDASVAIPYVGPPAPYTKILALDLGTTTGFAMAGTGDTTLAGSVRLCEEKDRKQSHANGAGKGWDIRFGALFELVRRWLVAWEGETRLVTWEDVQFVHSRDQIMLWTTLRAAVWGANLDSILRSPATLLPVTVGELKRFATGQWSAGKEAMLRAAVHQGRAPGEGLLDDNAIDAIHLLHFAVAHLNGSHETRRITKKRKPASDRRHIADLPAEDARQRSSAHRRAGEKSGASRKNAERSRR